jgi:alpha-glucuronidase
LEFQAGHARVWRDAICNYFQKISGIRDALGRVGNYPDRVEAESMQLNGYAKIGILPWENASGGEGIECAALPGCSAVVRFDRAAGWYDLDVEYYDQSNGDSKFRVLINGQFIDEWVADRRLTAKKPGGDSSSRRRIKGVALRPGDEIKIEGIPDRDEHAGLDFISIYASK